MSAPQQKPGQPVVGFNHNLSYKGRTFHVQTEDSGPQHGHLSTHVFLGGNILASTKSSYAALVPTLAPAELAAAVRKRMEEQHKAMMKGLLAGQHDAEIGRRVGQSVYEPGVLADGEKAPGLLVGGEKTPAPAKPVVRTPAAAPAPRPAPRPMASSLPARPLPAPARATPPALQFGTAASPRSLDEVILAYLAAELDER